MRAAIAQSPILRLMLPTGCARAGPVAQRLEPAAHNGLVGGSIPSRPTRAVNPGPSNMPFGRSAPSGPLDVPASENWTYHEMLMDCVLALIVFH